MKNMIKKWLDIKDAPPTKTPTEGDLRLMIGEAFAAALSGKEDEPWCGIIRMYHIPNKLEQALKNASRETAGEIAGAHIERRIGGEAFIDEVVDRIRRKQLV